MKNRVDSLRLIALACAVVCAPLSYAQTGPTPELKELVVTSSRIAGPRDSQPFGTSVITAFDIQNAAATTVNDAIIRLLGVPGRQDFYGGGDYTLDLRGFGATADNNQVVIVDGIRINEADLGGTRLAGIPIESVEKIEVLRGNGSVLYGEGATGGVIIITTKAGAGAGRKNTASLSVGIGSNRLRELRANAILVTGDLSLDAHAASRKTDNYRDNFRSKTDAVSLAGQWSNSWLRLGARASQDSLDTGLPGALSAAQYRINPRQTSTPTSKSSIDNVRSSVFAEAFLDDWQLGLDAGWREKKLRSESSFGAYDYDVHANNYALRAKHTIKQATVSNSLVLGSDRGRWTRDVLGSFGSTASQQSQAWYLRDELTLASSATHLSFGLRTERTTKENSNASTGLAERQNAWEIGLQQPLSKELSIYGRLGSSFRLANVDEFGYTSPGVSLKAQKSRDTELGARYSAGPAKIEARWYRSALTNEIGFDPSVADPFGGNFGANVNFDPTRRVGLELDGSYALDKNLNLRANAALRKSSFAAGLYAGKDVPLAPRRSLSLHADWSPAAQHLISGGVNWVGSQYPDFDNQCTMPAYSTADLRYAYQWQSLELSVGVRNLFNRKHYTQAFGCVAGETSAIYPEAGRTVNAALRIKF